MLVRILFLGLALVGSAAAQDTNFPVGPQYLMTSGSPLFAQPIATPSLSLEAPLPGIPSLPSIGPVVSDQPYTSNPELRHQADLFPIYYGYAPLPDVEIISAELPRRLPASIVEIGVGGFATSNSLVEPDGITLAEAAAFWRTNRNHATRLYTNRDLDSLPGH